METIEEISLSPCGRHLRPLHWPRERPVDTSSGPRHALQTDIRYAGPHDDRGTCDSAADRQGAGAQRTCLCVRRAAGMLRACYRHAANALTVHPRVQMLILTSALLQTGTTCEKISGTNPEMEQPMQEERLAILEHPVVSGISDVLLSRGQRPGFRVSLRCQTAQQNGHGECDCGGLRQGVPVCVSSKRTTLLLCLQVQRTTLLLCLQSG